MRTAPLYSPDVIAELSALSGNWQTVAEYRRFQCVWLRAELGLTTDQIARALRLHPRSVKRIQARFAIEGITIFTDAAHGGRYHQNLSTSQEKELLRPFLKKAKAGGILTIHEIKSAYEQAVNHAVPKSTLYRMLTRHDWRKIAPRPRHPKADVDAQQTFKKTLPS